MVELRRIVAAATGPKKGADGQISVVREDRLALLKTDKPALRGLSCTQRSLRRAGDGSDVRL